jgi:hypothetical protein
LLSDQKQRVEIFLLVGGGEKNVRNNLKNTKWLVMQSFTIATDVDFIEV